MAVTDRSSGSEDGLADLVRQAGAGDEAAFASLSERHRRELHVHCYRMLGSIDEAEDLVQEAFLRAWRRRDGFEEARFRAWLYRIATNACLDFLARRARDEVPHPMGAAGVTDFRPPSIASMPWLQPYPDALLDELAAAGGPDDVVVARETIELAYVAALQLLVPRQRAVLLLRDVVGWSAAETATALGLTVAAVDSALQRSRATLRRHRAPSRLDRATGDGASDAERDVVRRFIAACESYDVDAMVALVHDDIRMTAPPDPRTWDGRDAFADQTAHGFGPGAPGVLRCLPVRANRQPAVAVYLRRWHEGRYRPFVLDVLRIEDGALVELTCFGAGTFPAFGLPPTPPPRGRTPATTPG